MQRREQYLLIGLITAVLLWQGAVQLDAWLLEPLRVKQAAFEKLQTQISETNTKLLQLARQRKNLNDWKKRSLPPDPIKAKQRPNALNAQRLYGDWLHDLAELSGFEELKVSSDVISVSRDNVFVSVHIKIEADAHYEQLCRFLERFYRTDLLHRVTALRIQSPEAEGNPLLQVLLDVEGLAIVGAPQNRRLFAQTTLVEDVSEDATEIIVESNDDFPKEPGFLVRVRTEYLKVTRMEGAIWTVERAQDSTVASNHPSETILEHVRLNRDVKGRTPEEFKQLLETDVFVKPAPPVQYKPRVAPLGEKTLTRGKPSEFTIVAMGYDPSKGRPEFSLVPPLIAGSRLDKATGRFSWSPTSAQKAGKYTFKFEVKHPSAPGGKLSDSVTVVLRDPNTAPKIATSSTLPVYLGREWKTKLQATDAETPVGKLSWKLGPNPPQGLLIDSQTGELTWTPNDATEVGEAAVQVIVSDDGVPAQSTTQTLKLVVQDDAAQFTYLTTIFSVNGNVLAKLYDRSQDKYTELRVGTKFSISDISGTVTTIDKRFLLFATSDATHRLDIGQSLREAAAVKLPAAATDENDVPDATRPANAVTIPAASETPEASGREAP